MTKKRNMHRGTLIPAKELAWVRSSTDQGSWGQGEPSQEEILIAHYNNRQRARTSIPNTISQDLRFAPEWISVIEYLDGDFMRKGGRPSDSESLFRRRSIGDTLILSPAGRQNVNSVGQFNKQIEKLKSQAARMRRRWRESDVVCTLGPSKIKKALSEELMLGKRHHDLLVNHDNNKVFLVVEAKKDDTSRIMRMTKEALGRNEATEKSVHLAAPDGGYAMRLEYGRQPVHISDLNQSESVIIIENTHHLESETLPEEYYEGLLRCRIRSTRLLDLAEKSWLEKRANRFDLHELSLRFIEFFSVEDREQGIMKLSRDGVEVIDAIFAIGMFDYLKPTEDILMYVKYSNTPKHTEGVAVTLLHEEDKGFLESALQSNGLIVIYYDENGQVDHRIKYDIRTMTMVAQGFPRHIRTFEARRWFILRVANANEIKLKYLAPHTEKVQSAINTFAEVKTRKIESILDYELYKTGHFSRIFRPVDRPWFEDMQGDLGARCFLRIALERPDCPWRVAKRKDASHDNPEFVVSFIRVDTGITFIEEILKVAQTEPIFRCDLSDRYGPKIIPMHVRQFHISRALRIVMNSEIRILDRKIRGTFPTLMENEDPMMMQENALYYGARLFEKWSPAEDVGVIGVQGWNHRCIRYFSSQLLDLFQPVEFNAGQKCPELLFGVGEIYARSLETEFENEVLIDFDKFRQVINVFGRKSSEAVKRLEDYQNQKDFIRIATEIDLSPPSFNDGVGRVLLRENSSMAVLREALGESVQHFEVNIEKNVLVFEGTIAAYQMTMTGLKEISSETFKLETRFRTDKDTLNMGCMACMSETESSSDFYRFDCGHTLCRGCANNMVQARIDEAQLVIECGVDGCNEFVSPVDIMNIVLGGPDRVHELDSKKLSRLSARTRQAVINNDRNMDSCYTVDCPGLLFKSDGPVEELQKCSTCARQYCRRCLAEPHPGNTCAEYQRLRIPEESLAEYVRQVGQDNIKNCPSCQILVEKREGCNHIECRGCGTHFCWRCLYVAQGSGDCYRHMTEVHGGHGGNYELPVFDEMEQALQHLILNEHRENNLHALALNDPFLFPNDEDTDIDEGVEVFRNQRLQPRRLPPPVPRRGQINREAREARNRQANREAGEARDRRNDPRVNRRQFPEEQ